MLTEETGPILMNAFQLIAMSRSLDLSGLFEEEGAAERKTRFTCMYPAKDIVHKIEETVRAMGFQVQRKNSRLNLLHIDPKSKGNRRLSVAAEVFEVNPSLHVVELRKAAGDIAEYREVCIKLSSALSLQQDDNTCRDNGGLMLPCRPACPCP